MLIGINDLSEIDVDRVKIFIVSFYLIRIRLNARNVNVYETAINMDIDSTCIR